MILANGRAVFFVSNLVLDLPSMQLPPLKTDPKYGCFPWWPEDGNDWVHPDDVTKARAMIPSGRVFRRDGTEGDYLLMHYGDTTLRVRRTLWQEVEPEGFELGDWVEVLSRGLRNEPARVSSARYFGTTVLADFTI